MSSIARGLCAAVFLICGVGLFTPAHAQRTVDASCWVDSYGRGAGTVPTSCRPGEEKIGALCYTRCPSSHPNPEGLLCGRDCPAGYRNDGLTCFRDAHVFGFPNCPWYNACGINDACATCPAGYHNDGCTCRRDPHLIGRTVPRPLRGAPDVCGGGRELNAGLCYANCRSGFAGDGPTCRWQCRGDRPVACGSMCASSEAACARETFTLVWSAFNFVRRVAGAFNGSSLVQGVAGLALPVVTRATLASTLQDRVDDVIGQYQRVRPANAATVLADDIVRAGVEGYLNPHRVDVLGALALIDNYTKYECEDEPADRVVCDDFVCLWRDSRDVVVPQVVSQAQDPSLLTCGQLDRCLSSCGNSTACREGCYFEADDIARGHFADVEACYESYNCGALGQPGCDRFCGPHIASCYREGNPARHTSCGAIYACRETCMGNAACERECYYQGNAGARQSFDWLEQSLASTGCEADGSCRAQLGGLIETCFGAPDDAGAVCPACADACPFDDAKAQPGQCGCGAPDADRDGDGAADCVDACPDDGAKVEPSLCGCGVAEDDADGDGGPDCIDECPADPGKMNPGTCGCGVDDLDGDGDGVADCIDECPMDADLQVAGPCGCAVPDDDADRDGVPDCLDGCPGDAGKAVPGVCGCGMTDGDADGDGYVDCVDSCAADPQNDVDGDGICADVDNCPGVHNPSQADLLGDGVGDLCQQPICDAVERACRRDREAAQARCALAALDCRAQCPDGACREVCRALKASCYADAESGFPVCVDARACVPSSMCAAASRAEYTLCVEDARDARRDCRLSCADEACRAQCDGVKDSTRAACRADHDGRRDSCGAARGCSDDCADVDEACRDAARDAQAVCLEACTAGDGACRASCHAALAAARVTCADAESDCARGCIGGDDAVSPAAPEQCLPGAAFDPDFDGVCGADDNCPDIYNPSQADLRRNGIGDLCEPVMCDTAERACRRDRAAERLRCQETRRDCRAACADRDCRQACDGAKNDCVAAAGDDFLVCLDDADCIPRSMCVTAARADETICAEAAHDVRDTCVQACREAGRPAGCISGCRDEKRAARATCRATAQGVIDSVCNAQRDCDRACVEADRACLEEARDARVTCAAACDDRACESACGDVFRGNRLTCAEGEAACTRACLAD